MSPARDKLRTACITVLGSGLLPVAPGTWGSLLATATFGLGWLAVAAFHAWHACPGWILRVALEVVVLSGILGSSFLAVHWGGWAIARFGGRDPRQFTLDELAGQWLALMLLPARLDVGWYALGCLLVGQFLLFRLFDILKLPPARAAERLPVGWGILADDLFAGLYANIVGQLLWRLTPMAAWTGRLATTG